MYHWCSTGFCPGTNTFQSTYLSYCRHCIPSWNQSTAVRQWHPTVLSSNYLPDLNKLISCIDALHIWFCTNGMALNPDKSEAILLGTRQWAHSYRNLSSVNIAGCQIPLADPLAPLKFWPNVAIQICLLLLLPSELVLHSIKTYPCWVTSMLSLNPFTGISSVPT